MQEQSEEQAADRLGQVIQTVQDVQSGMSVEEMLVILLAIVMFAFGFMGANSYHKKGKPAMRGMFLGFFTGGVLVALILMIVGAVK